MPFNIVGNGPVLTDTRKADADLKVGSCVKRTSTGFAASGAGWRSLCLVLPNESIGGENSDTIKSGEAARCQYLIPGQAAYALVLENTNMNAGAELSTQANSVLAKIPANGHPVAQLDEPHRAGTNAVFRRIRGV